METLLAQIKQIIHNPNLYPLRRRRRIALFLPAFLFLLPASLHANLAVDLGLGARATSLGGAFTAVADDFSAVFYNPAGLTQIDRAEISFMTLYATPEFSLSGRERVNLYHRISALRGIGGGVTSLDIPPVEMEATFGAVLGLAASMEYIFGLPKNTYMGLALFIPYESILRLSTVSMTTTFPHFPLYIFRLRTPIINLGLAYEITPRLSIGAGVNIFLSMTADTYATATPDILGDGIVEAINHPDAVPVVNREMFINPSPHAGILWRPLECLRLGVSYRGRMVAEIEGSQIFPLNLIDPATGVEHTLFIAQADPLVFKGFVNPHQVTLGIAWKALEKWDLSLDVTWNDWSDYVEGLGRRPEKPFEDTFVPRLGLEYRPGDNVALWAGYFFQKSPVSDQDRESNFLDFDKHAFSLGGSYTLPRPILRKRRLTVRGYFQYHHCEDRGIEKIDTGATVVRSGIEFSEYGPNYEISGFIINGGIEIVLHF